MALSQEAYSRGMYAIRRKAMGKRITFYGDPEGHAAYVELLQNPELRRAVERGSVLKEQARAMGFKSVEEYLQIAKLHEAERLGYIKPFEKAKVVAVKKEIPPERVPTEAEKLRVDVRAEVPTVAEAPPKVMTKEEAVKTAKARVMGLAKTWIGLDKPPTERLAEVVEKPVLWAAKHPPLTWVAEKLTPLAKRDPYFTGVVVPVAVAVKKKAEEGMKHLENIERKIDMGVDKKEVEKYVTLTKMDLKNKEAVAKYNIEGKNLEKEAKAFEKKYANRELEEKEYNQAVKEREALMTKIDNYETMGDYLNNFAVRRAYIEKKYDIHIKETTPAIVRISQEVWKGFLKAPIGVGVLGLGLAVKPEKTLTEAVKGIGKLPETIAKKPLKTLSQLGGGLAFYTLTGALAGKIHGKYFTKPRISQAIKTAKAVIDPRKTRISSMEQIKHMKISQADKVMLAGKLKQGYVIHRIHVKLVASSPKMAKFLPDIKGRYLELTTRTGKVVERIGMGEIVGTFKGKVFSADVLKEAVGKLYGDKLRTFTRTLVVDEKTSAIDVITGKSYRHYKPLKYYETTESIKLTKFKETGREFRITAKGKVELVKEITKPKAADISKMFKLGRPPPEVIENILKSLKGKPFGKTDITMIGKKLGAKIDIGEALWKGYRAKGTRIQTYDYATEQAIFKRILGKTPKPPKVSMKPFDFGKPPAFKVFKPAPSPKLLPTIPEPLRMRIWSEIFVKPKYQAPPIYPEQVFVSPKQITLTKIGGITYPELFSVPKSWVKVWGKTLTKPIVALAPIVTTAQYTKQVRKLVQPQKLVQKMIQPMKVRQMPMEKITTSYISPQVTKLRQPTITLQKLRQPSPTAPAIPISPMIVPPPFKIPTWFVLGEEDEETKKKRKKAEAKARRQARKYQASVGAVTLGIYAPKKPKRITGLELRPMIKRKGIKRNGSVYLKRIMKAFS